MKRLNDYMKPTAKHKPYWWLVLGELMDYCECDTDEKYKLIEGLSPEQIIMKGDWFKRVHWAEIEIEPSKSPYPAYPFCPPEYLKSGEWSCASAVYTIFAITYKYITGDYPYVGQIAEEILASPETLKQYVIDNQKGQLDLTRIPHMMRGLFYYSLRLNKTCRYQTCPYVDSGFHLLLEDYMTEEDCGCSSEPENQYPDMARLNDIIEKMEGTGHSDLGFIIFGMICRASLKRAIDMDVLKGICPKQIYLNADWEKGIDLIQIGEKKYPYTSYAYYPDNFIEYGLWDTSDTVFALASIVYRIYTGMLPYIDNPDEDIDELISNPRVENVAGPKRFPLYLDCIPEPLRPFFQKALALKKKDRYHSLKAAADDFFRLPFVGTLYNKSTDTPLFELELMQQEYLNRKNNTAL